MRPPVYPFESRTRWILASRYGHIAKAIELNLIADSLVQDRVSALVRWNRVRAVVTALLSLGIATTAVSYFANANASLAETASLLQTAAAIAGAFTGFLSLAYLFLTRLLNQIEADILMAVRTSRPV